jgi:hypothetical protein
MTEDTDFPVKRRANASSRIAYGYMPTEEDPCVCVPDPEFVPLMREAFDHIDQGGSLRETAAWLTEKTGVSISHQGINRIWKERRGNLPDNAREKKQKKERKRLAPKTGPAKAKAKVKRKAADAKRVLAMQQKKLDNWVDKDSPEEPVPVTPLSDSLNFDTIEEQKEERTVVFAPNAGPQTDFLAANEKEVLYGGAAGGGKTMALIADPMRYFGNGNFNGIILRRTNDELREIVWKTQELYPQAYPGAKWAEKKSQWTFPSGARIWLTYLDRPEDVLRYQGQAFSYVAFDELTQHPTSFAFDYMRSRLRTTDQSLPTFMRATTNPGGPGHGWVKRMFIDPAPENRAFDATDLDTGKTLVYPDSHERAGEPLFTRRFIPASLYDNPYLTADGSYEANLLSLPENQRRQLLEGDWAVADGAAFPEFKQSTHVVEPFDIPPEWRRFRSCDYGYSSFSAVHWFAIDPSYETLYVYRELYLSKHTGKDLGAAVLDAEQGDSVQYGVLDSSCWHNRGQIGPSIAEEMINMGCRWRPSDRTAGARVAGKNQFHQRLKIDDETGEPGIKFFNTCRQIIADLPVIPSDPRGSDDIDPRYATDHAYDSVRYGIMSRPRAASPFDMGRGVPTYSYRPADVSFGY